MDRRELLRGLEEGLVDISPLSDLCVDGTQEKIDEARAKIESGDWDVFDGVIECNDGNHPLAPRGEHMSDADITGNIHWYFKEHRRRKLITELYTWKRC